MIPNADGPPRHYSPHGPLTAVLANESAYWSEHYWEIYVFAADGHLRFTQKPMRADAQEQSESFSIACAYGHLKAAQWLLQRLESTRVGGEVRAQYEHDDLFYNACAYGYLEMAQWLWEKYQDGSDLVTVDVVGLHYGTLWDTCKADHLEIIQWLLSANIITVQELTWICRPKTEGYSRVGPKITAWFRTVVES
jgi:hypothetical protein